jgi:hypothetical protein
MKEQLDPQDRKVLLAQQAPRELPAPLARPVRMEQLARPDRKDLKD